MTQEKEKTCEHALGPFPKDPNVRSLSCLRCGKAIKLYASDAACFRCGGYALFGMGCIMHDEPVKKDT